MVRNSLALNSLVKLLPTPTAGDSRNSRNATANSGEGSTGHSGETLSDVAYRANGKLSAAWVTRLMGYPDGWLDLTD
jgi:hypothetical protein